MSGTLSYRAALKNIGEYSDIPAFPSGFASAPSSLRQAISAMGPTQVGNWAITEGRHQKAWTVGCQGVTHDENSWYFSQTVRPGFLNAASHQQPIIHRINPSNFEVEDSLEIPWDTGSTHIGDIDFHDGLIYAAMEDDLHQIAVLRARPTLQLLSLHPITNTQSDLPWCAIDPWTGYLWSSNFGHVTSLQVYDPKNKFRHVKNVSLNGADIDKVQGGTFTDNGHLLLTSDGYDDIRCFSVLNGLYLGLQSIEKSHGIGPGQEIEGLTFWRNRKHDNGMITSVHAILVDIGVTSGDAIFFKHYSSPNSV